MINVAVCGLSGKVGQEILKLSESEKKIKVVGALRSNKKYESFSEKKPDIMIDFSRAEFFDVALDYAVKNKLPLVCGTTGLSAKQKKSLEAAAKKIPLLWASNMSLGIIVLKKMLSQLSNISHYDFYIEEIHHAHKKDSPSGTGLTLKEELEKNIGKKTKDILAMRGGGVFGQHKIVVLGPEETLILEHNALNRTVFARGAIQAALWLKKKNKNGLYSIDDIF